MPRMTVYKMTPEQFTYWLQGFAELNTGAPTTEQWNCIKEHLSTVFIKKTPLLNAPAYVQTKEFIPPISIC